LPTSGNAGPQAFASGDENSAQSCPAARVAARITVDPGVAERARGAIERMVAIG